MISLTASSLSSSTVFSLKKPPAPPLLNLNPFGCIDYKTLINKKRLKGGICRAELSDDAPFVIAIGTCMLSSLVLATPAGKEDDDTDTILDSTDARFAVMGIISFIPFFNWLSWVFAWLDTGKRRYAIYAILYLVPYLRSNLSLSPEESWLPISSIIFGIVHVQLEASIRNGDLQAFQFFGKADDYLSSMTRKKDNHMERHQDFSKQGSKREDMNLPSAEESRDGIQQQGVLGKTLDHSSEHVNGDSEDEKKWKE